MSDRCRCFLQTLLTGCCLQAICKERQLGGRDSKDNLRAKLLRSVRQQLGLPVYGPENVNPATVRPPEQMNEEELRQLFASRCARFAQPLFAIRVWHSPHLMVRTHVHTCLHAPGSQCWPAGTYSPQFCLQGTLVCVAPSVGPGCVYMAGWFVANFVHTQLGLPCCTAAGPPSYSSCVCRHATSAAPLLFYKLP